MKIFYHADDFGVSYEQSVSIMDCYYYGKLNSVSLILNSPETDKSYKLIESLVDEEKIRCVAHLNFVEGKSLSNKVPHLVNKDGYFNYSFAYLLKLGISNKRDTIKLELQSEISAQLEKYSDLIRSRRIYIDSHQHYHMIPVVWEALWNVIEEEKYEVCSVRIPVDSITPIANHHLFLRVRMKNYIKWLLLWTLSKINYQNSNTQVGAPLFFGVPFTCRMTTKVVKGLISDYERIARERVRDLEIMFHPGAVTDVNKLLDNNNKALVDFYCSEYRDMEKQTLIELAKENT